MNWVDIALCGLIALGVVSGARKGISREGLGLAGVLVALLVAAWAYPANGVAFACVFIGLVCAAGLSAYLVGRWLRDLGWLDGFLGAGFGLVNGVVLSVVAVLALLVVAPPRIRAAAAGSSLAPFAVEAAQTAADLLPEEVRVKLDESYRQLERALPARHRSGAAPKRRNVI